MALDSSEFAERYLIDRDLESSIGSGPADRLVTDELADLTRLKGPMNEATGDEPDRFFEYRSRIFQGTLSEVDRELDVRRELFRSFIGEIDYQVSQAARSLNEFRDWGLGYNVGVDVKRNFLEKLLADLRTQRRREQLKAWPTLWLFERSDERLRQNCQTCTERTP